MLRFFFCPNQFTICEIRQRTFLNGNVFLIIQIERGWNSGVFCWVPEVALGQYDFDAFIAVF